MGRVYELEDGTVEDRTSADEVDRASGESQHHADEAVRRQLARSRAQRQPPCIDGLCPDCDGPVEPGRLRLGLGRCLGCQVDRESVACQEVRQGPRSGHPVGPSRLRLMTKWKGG